ncbi:MAG: insulinase family protein [Chitinophagales bacterium]
MQKLSRLLFLAIVAIQFGCSHKSTKTVTATDTQNTAVEPAPSEPPVTTTPATPTKPAAPSAAPVETEKVNDIATALLNNQPLPLNPDVRTGTLPNGLKYYVQKNSKPENRVELRLAVNAGSNQEDATQKGLAHFVEHMAFNGSKHFSKNELVNYLESIGTKFGPHLNAYTSFDETVYMLQIPTDKKEILDKGLTVLEDWAGGLSFEPAEIDKERGVVVSEWRSGQGAGMRLMNKYLPTLYYKSRYAERLPIGDTAILMRAPYERLSTFYKDWYRPDLMAVVIVGDIDAEMMEKEIKIRFGALKNPTIEKKKEVYDLPKHKETLVSICTDPEATYSRAMIMYKHPAINGNSADGYKSYLANALFNGMLNNRLQEIIQKPNPPFFAAYSGYERETRNNDAYSLTGIIKSGQTVKGLETLLAENERVKRFGFTQTELDRQKIDLLTGIENAAKEKDKTESASFVREYVSNFLENEPAPGIEAEFKLAKLLLPAITLNDINALATKYITDDNCVIVLTAPESEKKFLPWENDIKELAVKAKTKDLKPYVDVVVSEPLLPQLPKSSPIVKETKNDKYNITTLELKNGVRVILKPTNFKNDEILMTAYSPGGSNLYSDEDFMSADYSNAIVAESGVSTFDKLTLEKMLTGKTVNVYPYVGEMTDGFEGNCVPNDLEVMLQLVYLYATQPRKSKEDFNTFMEKQKASVELQLSNPGSFFANKFQNLIYNKNIRRGITTVEKLDKVDFDKAMKIYNERFSNASDFTFIFVGNLDVEKIKPMLEAYLGGLPSNGTKETWKDAGITKKDGNVVSKVEMGKTPKDLVGIHFHGDAKWNDEDNYIFNSMVKVLSIQLREAMREDKGGVYGVGVNGAFVQRPKNEYGITIQFNTDPNRVDELVKAVYDNISLLQTNGPSAEKITKVQETQRRERETDLKENEFWLSKIQYCDEYNYDINKLDEYAKQIDGLTAEKVKAAFNKYFDMKNKVELILTPEK